MQVKKSILIADDDKGVLRVLRIILEKEGYEVDTAETGKEFLQKAEARYYNLALLDIKLPDMDGTELLSAMRQRSPKTVKIMLTGYPSFENSIKSLNLGADAYLVKPIKPDDLLQLVRKKLGEQEGAEAMTQEKMDQLIEMRLLKLEQAYETK
jgi:DNA-binding response OmpR family regulator